jgi:hypothetical protein
MVAQITGYPLAMFPVKAPGLFFTSDSSLQTQGWGGFAKTHFVVNNDSRESLSAYAARR